MKPIDGDKLRGHLEMLILATLEREEGHGLEILRRLEAGGCGLLRLREGSLYPALYRLENAGEVQAVWEKETHGRRGARGRIYRLTQKGTRKLQAGRGEWTTFVATIGNLLGVSA
jgi:PadR family transcriptional regulator, regulatory protein PadR